MLRKVLEVRDNKNNKQNESEGELTKEEID